jgi:hypothetical protein
MKALDINKVVDAKPTAVFSAKVAGAVKYIQVKGWAQKGVIAVVVHCEAGANWNFDVTRGEEIEVSFRGIQAVAFDSHLDFRKDVMAKAEAHGYAAHNY